jgi:hypothetical protein
MVDRLKGKGAGRPVYGLPRLSGVLAGMTPARISIPVSPPTGEIPKVAKRQRGDTPFGVAVLVVVFVRVWRNMPCP